MEICCKSSCVNTMYALIYYLFCLGELEYFSEPKLKHALVSGSYPAILLLIAGSLSFAVLSPLLGHLSSGHFFQILL